MLYIDEIGRASRDGVEAMRLGRLVESRRKRLIGVSDGFDSTAPMSKLMLSIFATWQEWFIDQLRCKVHRGMEDAFDRGTNLHAPSVGYQLVPAVDAHGRPLFGQDGEQLNMKVILEEERLQVLSAFEGYGLRGENPRSIARRFNEAQVGGMQSWSECMVLQLLRRRTYVGIEIYRMTHRVVDPETGKVTVLKRPRKEWRVRRMRQLQIVPWALEKLVRRRLERNRAAWSKDRKPSAPTRTDAYPKVLIRPVCGSCGSELAFGRSGTYPSFCCLQGSRGQQGCSLTTYKSVRIVDDVILGHLSRAIFTSEYLDRVVEAANRHLKDAAARPRQDTGPLEAEIRSTVSKRDRLVKILENGDETGLDDLVESLRRHEKTLKELRGRLAEVKAQDQTPPPPLTATAVAAMLTDLHGLLKEDVAVAAPLFRELTGPVVVEQTQQEGGKRPVWITKFTVNLVPVLATLSASRKCPTRPTWESLGRL